MYQVSQILVTKKREPALHAYLEGFSVLSRNLRNAALFRMRQRYTAYTKEILSDNEAEVLREIQLVERLHDLKVKRVISYKAMEKMMRETNNPDFFSGLPMQTAQQVLKRVNRDFRGWLSALADYKKHPEKYLGVPEMPKYKKKSKGTTYVFTNQDAVLYPKESGFELKLPMYSRRVSLPHLTQDVRLKEVHVKPYFDNYILILILETTRVKPTNNQDPYIAAIDLGVSNTAAIVCNDSSCLLYKGGALKARNQWYNKELARLKSIMMKGHDPRTAQKTSRRTNNLTQSRNFFIHDTMHKISTDIIAYCKKHKVGTLVIGHNKGWKQGPILGRINNQKFQNIPFTKMVFMLTYKAEQEGIKVLLQEESYTSQASFLDRDLFPFMGEGDKHPKFSGKRITRALYRSKDGTIIHADLNGAGNILRKALPEAFDEVSDFLFLQSPVVVGYKDLRLTTHKW